MELPPHDQTRDQCCICEGRFSWPAARRREPVTDAYFVVRDHGARHPARRSAANEG
jgi:hypothetical protein